MWEKIETWHWTMLVAVISVLSVLLFQQQVLAQWNPPDDSPGSTSLNHIVVTPMEEDLNLSGYKINDPSADAVFYIDPSDATDIRAAKANFNELCIAGVCNTTWPSGSSGFTSLWSTSTINEDNIYYSDGNVGIGTNDPESALHIYSNAVNGSDIRLLNTTGDMSIIFQEYEGSPGDIGDFFITYNGGSGGFANWLEFYGKPNPPSTDDGRPVMTMQRDYVAAENTYKGVGIGVPSGTNISARLRVQNYGTEDILQLYDGSSMKFQVADGGYVGINGAYHDAVPLFIRSGGTSGLKVYNNGIYSWNLSNLELKATNDIYLNSGSYDGVGVGISDPQQNFHVKNSNGFSDALIRLENNSSGAFSNQTTQVEFVRGPNPATDYSWVGPTDANTFDVWTMESIPMLFGVGADEKMRINSTDIIMDTYLRLAKQAGVPPAVDCDQDPEMGRVKVDNINDLLYVCTGDPTGGIPGSWKSVILN